MHACISLCDSLRSHLFRFWYTTFVSPPFCPCSGVAKLNYHLSARLNFLSINRFERKKNLGLAISAFALLRSVVSKQSGDALLDASLTVAGDVCIYIIHSSILLHHGSVNNINSLTADTVICISHA